MLVSFEAYHIEFSILIHYSQSVNISWLQMSFQAAVPL